MKITGADQAQKLHTHPAQEGRYYVLGSGQVRDGSRKGEGPKREGSVRRGAWAV